MRRVVLTMVGLLLLADPALAGTREGVAAFARQDYRAAYDEWRAPAAAGDPLAQYNLAVLYETGKGVEQDPAAAAKWYELAAGQGYGPAQYNLGLAYLLGRGLDQDDRAAAKWFRTAADQGVALAQYNLGVLHASGRGVPQDPRAAVKWTALAAKQGLASAQYNLGVMYADGWGVAQDQGAALHWYRLAAEQGQTAARAAAEKLEARSPGPTASTTAEAARPQVSENRAAPATPSQAEIRPAPAPVATAPETRTASAAPAPRPALPPAGGKTFAVQLVSLSTAEAAAAEGARLARTYSGLLSGLDLEVQRASLADRNQVYRVRFAPLDTQAAARDLCQRLKAQAQDCLVLAN